MTRKVEGGAAYPVSVVNTSLPVTLDTAQLVLLIASKNILSFEDNIVASIVHSQAGAYQLTKDFNIITVCDNDGDTVKLPEAAAGKVIYIYLGDTLDRPDVWPYAGDQILPGNVDEVTTAATFGRVAMFMAIDNTRWYSSI